MRHGAALVFASIVATSSPAAPTLRCDLEAPAQAVVGAALPLRFTLRNDGPGAWQVLRWNTPLDGGWFAPFVEVTRDGTPLPFQGPMLKRGDPGAQAYVLLPAGASLSAELDLALPFDFARPGHYHVRPRLHLVDVFDAAGATPPRPRSAHAGFDLECPALEVRIVAAPRG